MQGNHSITPSTSLESVAQQFAHWRETRSSKKEKIPAALWALVTPLLEQHNRNKVSSALRVSYAQLRQALSVSLSQQKRSPFVECSLAAPLFPTEQCRIEFTCKNGSTVKISGLTLPHMQVLVSLLLGS